MVITEQNAVGIQEIPASYLNKFTVDFAGMHRLTQILVRERDTLSDFDKHLLGSLSDIYAMYYMAEDQRQPLGYTADTPEQQAELIQDRVRRNKSLSEDATSPIDRVEHFRELQSQYSENETGIPVDRMAPLPRMTVVFKRPEYKVRVRQLLHIR